MDFQFAAAGITTQGRGPNPTRAAVPGTWIVPAEPRGGKVPLTARRGDATSVCHGTLVEPRAGKRARVIGALAHSQQQLQAAAGTCSSASGRVGDRQPA